MGIRLPKTKGMLRREAASWLACLQSGRDPDVERKFHQWRAADPRNAATFDRVRESYEQAGLLRHSAIAASELQQMPAPNAQRQFRPALAAAAAVAVLVPIGLLLVPLSGTHALMLMTRVGEIRQVNLADGSKVTLDTATRVEVEIGRSRRTAHLRYGRARFQVAQSGTPFVVDTASATITTSDGIVDVEQADRKAQVRVLAGAAEVRGPEGGQAAQLSLHAGEAVTTNPAGPEVKVPAATAQDWTRGMLQFDATPLADAVALANRYSRRQIILHGDIEELRVTGAFRAGDTAGFAKALAAAFGLSLQLDGHGSLILSQRASPRLRNKSGG